MALSLRARVVLGALMWTIGLLAAAHIISLALLVRYPHLKLIAHSFLMAAFAVACMAAGFAFVRRGLSPLNELRARLSSVRSGRAARLTGRYPAEVQPLVDDLNQLLEHRERAIGRAIAKAGDLAHGLKTPLAVLFQEADRARAAGHDEIADALSQHIERMRRQIDYHLAHARAAASGAAGQRSNVAASADGLARTLRRLYADRGVDIETGMPSDHTVHVRSEDLDEMLGNLLDNACKWARSRVVVSASTRDGRVAIAVDDDGPGLDPSMREAVLQRGVRADEAETGSGFGLAIVRDLAEVYGGSVTLDRSDLGGVRAVLTLESAKPEA